MKIKLSLDTTGITRMQRIMSQDQIPFATAVAMNEVARLAQDAQHEHIKGAFRITRPGFTLRSVKHTPRASKRQLWTVLKIEPPGGAARADILSKFEEGGTKKPQGTRIAIPQDVRRNQAGGARGGQRPKDFGFKLHGRGPKADVYVGDKRTFMIKPHSGSGGGVFTRMGGRSTVQQGRDARTGQFGTRISGRRGAGKTRMLYSFARSAKIDDRLKFELNVGNTVMEAWPTSFGRAFDQAMRTSGMQVTNVYGSAMGIGGKKGRLG